MNFPSSGTAELIYICIYQRPQEPKILTEKQKIVSFNSNVSVFIGFISFLL